MRLDQQRAKAALNKNSHLKIREQDFKDYVYSELSWIYKHNLDVQDSIDNSSRCRIGLFKEDAVRVRLEPEVLLFGSSWNLTLVLPL